MNETGEFWVGLMVSLFFVAMVVTFLLVWLPAISECNAVHGELVTNAFNWPVCVPSAK